MKVISPVHEDTVNFSQACTLYERGDRELTKQAKKKRKDAGTETKETQEQSKVNGNTS